MTMAETLLKSPEIEHGIIRIAFTPDEEVGSGVDYFDVPSSVVPSVTIKLFPT